MSDPVETPPTPAPTAPAAPEQEPAWLAGRLQRERETAMKQFLSELGVADVKDAKAGLKALKEAERAKMSEVEQLRTRLAELEPMAPKLTAYQEALSVHAKAEVEKLTEGQRAAVIAISGEDPAAQLKAIATLRPTWVSAPAPAPAPAAPANTAPPAAAPAPASAPSPTNHRAVYESLKMKNPIEAAIYLQRHGREIYPNQ